MMQRPTPHAQAINAAMVLLAEGKSAQAIASLQRLIQKHSGDPELNHALGIVLLKADQAAQAQFYLERAVKLDSQRAGFHANLGACMAAQRKWKLATPHFQRAVDLDPTNAAGWAGLVQALTDSQDFDAAADAAERLVSLRPDLLDGYNNGALALAGGGRAADAVALAERGVAALPGNTSILRTLMGVLAYTPAVETQAFTDRCRATGDALIRESSPPVPFNRKPDPDRPLSVVLLSPDLRGHSVSFFLESLFKHHDRSRLRLTGCMTSEDTDSTTDRLRSLADAWIDASRLTPADIVQRIVREGTDVLIDLAGYSRGGRLGVMACRAAPVQMTYLGWPTTTGLRTVDWRLVDSITDPPGSESMCSERLLRIDPCFLCYTPPSDAPEPNAHAGPVTFGSFNVLTKVVDECLDLWCEVLRAVPESRMLLKAAPLAIPSSKSRIVARFESRGVSASRLDLVPRTAGVREHLELYSKVDVALDTSPYNGTTTTCEALFMGVPVVTRAGRSHAGRVGMSLLSAIGEPGLVAHSNGEYIAKATELAKDGDRRNRLRTELRPRLLASVLCDGPGFADRFESAIRAAWREYCSAHGG